LLFRLSVRLCLMIGLQAAGAAAFGQAPGGRVAEALRSSQEPRLDGRLDDACWSRAATASDFVQREPRNGQPALEQTEVSVVFSNRTLFVGARLHDREAARLVASEYRRDAELESNDTFEVFLDTFHDRRNAFYFATNPVGTQRDGLIRNEGEDLNWQWDGVWSVACSRDADGWTVEMAIPFSTLRFPEGTSRDWGINFGRLVARTREESFWAPISRDFGFFGKWRISAFGVLRGIDGVESRARFQLWPFVLGGFDRDREDPVRKPNGWTGEAGLDAKAALGSSVVADLTLHTDFAQVESDQQQVNLTRFPLFYPEKRAFFLENAGLFRVGERLQPFEPPSTLLFFSRRIGLSEDGDVVPIIGGARVTGKIGPWDFGGFDIISDRADFSDGSSLPRTNFAALRIKRDVLSRSSVGAMVLAKSPAEEGPSNQVAAVDGSLALGSSFSMLGFAARSFTPGLGGPSHALNLDAALTKDGYGLSLAYLDIGDDFNSEMGFLQRTGVRKYRGSGYLAFRPGWPGVRQVFAAVDTQYFTDRLGNLETQLAAAGPGIVFHDGAFLFLNYIRNAEGLSEPFELRDQVDVPIGTYRGNQLAIQYFGSRSRRISARGGLVSGAFYGGALRSYNFGLEGRPYERLNLGIEFYGNDVDVPVEGGEFATSVLVGRATLAFSPQAFVRALVQRDDDSRELRANVMFRYTYKPGADLYFVYDETRGILGELPQQKQRKILVKMTFYFIPR
ncbi:MAG: carbohydrate binding family 9 domain-containing protein, partial [Acidobacteria bacterium]|nr:carbohydrate binding family 9 domain-containing protein [Acidobacteriota bacterium]